MQTNSMPTLEDRIRKLWPVLLRAGVEQVRMEYEGSGDSGEFMNPEYVPEESKEKLQGITVTSMRKNSKWDRGTNSWVHEVSWVDEPVEHALSDIASEVVHTSHAGWENNEGGCGSVVMDCEEFTIMVKHEQYERISHYSQHKIDAKPSDLEFIVMKTET
jgi:hypothetical protein